MRASGLPRRGVEGLAVRAGRLAGLWQHVELPREPAPEAPTYVLLLGLTQGIKLALNCIVYDISKY